VNCRGKAMHALGGCEYCFTPTHFLELLESEYQWFDLLNALRQQRWQRAWPEESLEGQAVILMLRDRAWWLRN
jgi:hypothetical protein